MYLLKSVGADPEFFLKDGWGNPIPAIGKMGGTKLQPKLIGTDAFSAVQEDNVMVEFNIPPSRNAKEFADNIIRVRDHCVEVARKQGLVASIEPSLIFGMKELVSDQAWYMGCEPDYNAWTLECNSSIDAKDMGTIRVSGGHVHVSYEHNVEMPTNDDRVRLIRMMDLCLGVPSVLLDKDLTRRKYYGKAGSFRPKSYGVEYRTLSNFWIRTHDAAQWVFKQVERSFANLNNNVWLSPEDETNIVKCINKAEGGLANELISKFGVVA